MNRLEQVRQIVDNSLHRLTHPQDRRAGFVHLYGVSLTATALAHSRQFDPGISAVAGMLHDFASYESGDAADHGPRSAKRAAAILRSLGTFAEEEIARVHSAITHHSSKEETHAGFEELLKDADVLQHYLYNVQLDAHPRHIERRTKLLRTSALLA